MAARITRAKKKIAAARIPYRVPPRAELPDRVDAVLTVVHLLFTTGHAAPVGETLIRADLADRSRDLVRMLAELLPGTAEVTGLLALILLTDARRAARVDAGGQLVLLADQDRSRWDQAAIAEGLGLVRGGAAAGTARAVHADGRDRRRARRGGRVRRHRLARDRRALRPADAVRPSPVVALNRAVAIGFAAGPAAGPAALDELAASPELAGDGYLAASRASFLRRLDRADEARLAYSEALAAHRQRRGTRVPGRPPGRARRIEPGCRRWRGPSRGSRRCGARTGPAPRRRRSPATTSPAGSARRRRSPAG